MKLMAAAALAGALVAAPFAVLGSGLPAASATPSVCDGLDCVPFVERGVAAGERCNQSTRYNFGVDASGNTLQCSSRSTWIAWSPLVGVRTLRSACNQPSTAAQTPDGFVLACLDGVWTAYHTATFYR